MRAFKFDRGVYHEWARSRSAEMSALFSPEAAPTVKAVLFLALLDFQDTDCSYQDLEDQLRAKRVVAKAGAIPRDGLRVGMRDLTQLLEKHDSGFRLRRSRGSEGRFRLERAASTPTQHVSNTLDRQGGLPNFFSRFAFDHPKLQSLAWRQLLSDNRALPAYLPFCLPGPAARWIGGTRDLDNTQMIHLACDAWAAFETVGFLKRRTGDGEVISMVGLGVGEGMEEIALLEKVLQSLVRKGNGDEKGYKQVHYLAIDLSPFFLASHAHQLCMTFAKDMSEGRLVCTTILGDIEALKDDMARTLPWHPLQVAREQTRMGSHFLPRSSPMLVTYLGNNLGDEPVEWQRTLFLRIFKNRLGDGQARGEHERARLLVGISFARDATEEAHAPDATERAEHKRDPKTERDVWGEMLKDTGRALEGLFSEEYGELVEKGAEVQSREAETRVGASLLRVRSEFTLGTLRLFALTRYTPEGLHEMRQLIEGGRGLALAQVRKEDRASKDDVFFRGKTVPTVTGKRTCGLFAVQTTFSERTDGTAPHRIETGRDFGGDVSE